MKKISILIAILCVGLFAVFSCSKRSQLAMVNSPTVIYDSGVVEAASVADITHDAAVNDVPVDEMLDTIAQDNWEFKVPGPDWVAKNNNSNNSDIKIILTNDTLGCRLMFVKMQMPFSFNEFAVLSITSIQNIGATVQGATELSFHGSKVIVVESSQGEDIFWTALVEKDGKPNTGYTLVCGSYDVDDITNSTISVEELTKTCAEIISTLKIH